MPRTGRPPKPTEQKRRLGNPGRRPLPKPADVIALSPVIVVDHTPTPDGDGLVRTLLDGPAAKWIATTDRPTLDLLRDAWDRRASLVAYLADHGYSYELDGRWLRRPEATELVEIEKRITTWLSLLGLTPSDRSRLGVAEVKAANRLEELQARRAARLGPNRAG